MQCRDSAINNSSTDLNNLSDHHHPDCQLVLNDMSQVYSLQYIVNILYSCHRPQTCSSFFCLSIFKFFLDFYSIIYSLSSRFQIWFMWNPFQFLNAADNQLICFVLCFAEFLQWSVQEKISPRCFSYFKDLA